MPKGLLDKLTREEILDLIAYIAAGGDANHPLFKGDHARGHGAGGGIDHFQFQPVRSPSRSVGSYWRRL